MPFFTRSALLPQLAQLGIRLDKQKGQCYLIDQNLANFIIAEAELNPEIDTVLEIGPGLGTLSDFLAAKSRQLFLIEYDKKMVHFLAENFQLQYESVLINPDMQSIPSEARIILYQGDALENTISFRLKNRGQYPLSNFRTIIHKNHSELAISICSSHGSERIC